MADATVSHAHPGLTRNPAFKFGRRALATADSESEAQVHVTPRRTTGPTRPGTTLPFATEMLSTGANGQKVPFFYY